MNATATSTQKEEEEEAVFKTLKRNQQPSAVIMRVSWSIYTIEFITIEFDNSLDNHFENGTNNAETKPSAAQILETSLVTLILEEHLVISS